MTLKHLEALYWVWRLGSFTAAAERLHSTQSAISMRIRDLEEALGQELFDRTARAARLTTKGQELVGYAERVMELMAEIKARIGDPTIVSGIVRIGVTEYVALTWLPDLVRELNARFPRVTLEMNVDLTLSLLDKLSGGEIDLAMLPGPIVQPGLRNISLGFVEFAWMASPALKIPDRPLTPRDLDNWPILTLSKTSNLYAQLEPWFEESGAVGRRTDTCNSLSVLASWTISGLGIGYLPIEHFGRDIRAGRLCRVGSEQATATTFLVWGDSHARVMSDAIGAAAARAGTAGLLALRVRCAPLPGAHRSEDGSGDQCHAFNQSVLDFLAGAPTVTDVILAGRWGLLAEAARQGRARIGLPNRAGGFVDLPACIFHQPVRVG